ncbi:MAG: hypothetical protein Q9218_007448 [Villophora microphyllina]
MCTAIQRVSWLNKALKAAHNQVDELETTIEDLREKLEDVKDESERNEELETAMAKMELDKECLQKLVDADARSKVFQAQLEKERMSTLRVAELEGQLDRTREDHQAALVNLQEVQHAIMAKLVSEHALTMAHAKKELEDLDKAHKTTTAQLVNDHGKHTSALETKIEILKLEHQLKISELQRVHQQEIMNLKENQSSHMHFQGTYRPQAGQEPANSISAVVRDTGRFVEES